MTGRQVLFNPLLSIPLITYAEVVEVAVVGGCVCVCAHWRPDINLSCHSSGTTHFVETESLSDLDLIK